MVFRCLLYCWFGNPLLCPLCKDNLVSQLTLTLALRMAWLAPSQCLHYDLMLPIQYVPPYPHKKSVVTLEHSWSGHCERLQDSQCGNTRLASECTSEVSCQVQLPSMHYVLENQA